MLACPRDLDRSSRICAVYDHQAPMPGREYLQAAVPAIIAARDGQSLEVTDHAHLVALAQHLSARWQ
jgi:hypothetical protein